MLKISIIYFGDVYAVNGVNFVTRLILDGAPIFIENNISINNIVCLNGVISSEKYLEKKIGHNANSGSIKMKTKLRHIAAKLLDSKNRYFAWFKLKSSLLKPAKKVVENYDFSENEALVFQDLFTAFFYLNKYKSKRLKSLLILHCSSDPYEQLLGYYPSIINTPYHKTLLDMKDYVYQNIDHIVFISKSAFDNNFSKLKGKSSLIYNGIPNIFSPINLQDKDILKLVCVGSINGHKGQEILIDSILKLKNDGKDKFKLYFIGSGSEEQKLILKIEKLNLGHLIEFLGIRNDVQELLKEMDVMVLPSKSEGMPISILEGMRQGMFILSTKVGAIPEMLTSDFGKFIERNPDSISTAISELLDNKDLIRNAKMKSRDFFFR